MDLRPSLDEILRGYAAGREPGALRTTGGESAGLAVVIGDAIDPTAAWVPATARVESAYLAYSITKTVTAALILQLRDERRLALDDRLARWFPRIDRAAEISLRQLLNHTAGLPDYGALASYQAAVRTSPSTPWTFERFAAETFDRGLRFDPGTGWAYSNPGYMLLKRIVEDLADRSFADLVAERIAGPLGLARTFVPASVEDLRSLAPATSRALADDRALRDVREHYHPGWVSHGVVASTPSDIARFLHALFRGRIVSADSLREMTALVPVPMEPGARAPWAEPSYGLGIMADPRSRWGRVWGHNGGGPGYSTSAFHAPDLDGLSVCAMCTQEAEGAQLLVFAALDALASR